MILFLRPECWAEDIDDVNIEKIYDVGTLGQRTFTQWDGYWNSVRELRKIKELFKLRSLDWKRMQTELVPKEKWKPSIIGFLKSVFWKVGLWWVNGSDN